MTTTNTKGIMYLIIEQGFNLAWIETRLLISDGLPKEYINDYFLWRAEHMISRKSNL